MEVPFDKLNKNSKHIWIISYICMVLFVSWFVLSEKDAV